MEETSITRQFITATIASTVALCGGFHTSWASPSLVKLQAEDSDLPITSDQGAWIASTYYFALAVGALFSTFIADKWGRKLVLLFTAILDAAGCILIAAAQNYLWLIIARFVAGLSSGGMAPVLLMYLGEIASDRVRGAFGVILHLMENLGMLLVYCVGNWTGRVPVAGVGLVLPIIFAVSFVWMPESPYFLVMKKRLNDAEKSLAQLRGTSDVEEELSKVQRSISKEQTGTLRELIMTPANRKVLIIITMVTVGPQISGISAIYSYTGLIFEASGSALSSGISIIIVGVVQLLGGGLSVFPVDLTGRRPLLLLSIGGTIVSVLAEALYFQLQAIGADVSSISWLPMTAIIGYVVSYSFGLGCIPYIILSEILPCNIKAVGMTYGICVTALSAMAVSKLYQVIADAYGIHVSFYVFATCSFLLWVCVYFILPETKQKSFSAIQDELRSTTASKLTISTNLSLE